MLRTLSARWSPLRRRTFTSFSPRTDHDRQLLVALRVFYDLEGHFTVPLDFVVPTPAATDVATSPWPQETWGMSLGQRFRLFTRGRGDPHKNELLQSIGFPFPDWRTYVWEMQIIPALKVFKAQEGHLFVRQHFQVPKGDDKWPRAAWGVNLGRQCQLLRRDVDDGVSEQRKAQLDAMGFVWSDSQWKWQVQFLTALSAYKQIYGHCNVHRTFKVPRKDPLWPEVIWGYKLGHAVAKVKTNVEGDVNTSSTPLEMEDLKKLEFLDHDVSFTVWREALMPCLELYPSTYGNTCIPKDFVVPHEAPWPERAWGIHLGYIVDGINSMHMFRAEIREDKPKLKAIGYVWESLFGKWTKELLPALRLYKAKYGHCDVPSWWIVPTNDNAWPTVLRGYELGKYVVRVRRNGRNNVDVADVLPELDALGFQFTAFESNFVDRVLPALEVYATIYGDTHVPPGFIVPSNSTWPEPSWGTKLGRTVRIIRNQHQYAQQVERYRDRLEKIGFVWSTSKSLAATKREIVDPCVEVFKQLHGPDAEIPRNFIVPADDARYPEVAKGFELGAWLAHYHKRTSAPLPLQTQEGRRTMLTPRSRMDKTLTPHAEQYWKEVVLSSFHAYAKLHGSCASMDDNFVIPREEPYPQSAWGLHLGLRLRHLRYGIRYALEITKFRDELVELGVLRDEKDEIRVNEEENDVEKDGDVDDIGDEEAEFCSTKLLN
ncbi:hypothetical protein PsorP6_013543 [Peronosclerospora sorghi]|uniref:Uncharacterized protein n=1 Tax=Peronosclerospora sorghi TaxID=230839 RepID=A0ACC0VFZ6_9STRA|nr:hypothetical protein PsorP6_013543 [Peronosclerospora sorghi]